MHDVYLPDWALYPMWAATIIGGVILSIEVYRRFR